MPPTPNRNRQTYRIKSTDNALTLPGRTFFPKGTYISRPPFTLGTGTQASGLSGVQGSSAAMYPSAPGINTTGFTPPNYNRNLLDMRGRGYQPFQGVPGAFYQNQVAPLPYNADMRGRGYNPNSPPNPNYGTDDSWYRPVAQPGTTLPPPVAPGMVETAIGTGSEEFMNTRFMQKNIENNTPFERQLRWNPEKKRYEQIGTLIKKGQLDVKTGRMRKSKGARMNAREAQMTRQAAAAPVVQQPVAQPVQQTVQLPSIANAFVSFRA